MDHVLTENVKTEVLALQEELSYKFENTNGHWGEIHLDSVTYGVKFAKPYSKEILEAEVYEAEFNSEGRLKVLTDKKLWTLYMKPAGFVIYDSKES